MKRKVKFQEGGEVESPRNRQLRETMERFGREGRRVGLAERARQRQVAERGEARAAAAERRASQRADAELSRQPAAYESDRRRNIGPQAGRPDFTTGQDGTTRRGAATGREVVPATQGGREAPPPRPSMQRAMTEVMTPRQMPLGRVRPPVGGNLATIVGGTAAAAAEPLANYARSYMDRRAAEADARREANLQAFRNQEVAQPSDGPTAGSMQNAPRPTPRPTARPAQAPRPRVREMTADELNEMELRRIRAERQMEDDDARERMRLREEMMAAPVDIGAASARARGEQVGPPGDYNMKKGGIVKKKAGGMIKAAPKKMMKGGVVAKPKSKPKAKPAGKPMPFKKGGVIKKGRK